MRNKKSVGIKKCPFYDEDCLEDICQIYNEKLKNCLFYLINYNLYTLKETLKGIHLIKE